MTSKLEIIKAFEGDYEVFTCTYVLNELIRVVSKKIPNKLGVVGRYLCEMQKHIHIVDAAISFKYNNDLLRDKKDIPILNSALFCECDILITGDKDFLEAGLTAIKAITASEFLYKY